MISTVANIVPERVKAMVDAVLDNDIQTARQLHLTIAELVAGCSIESNPIPVKTALAMMGDMQEVFRLPLCNMSPQNRTYWSSILELQGLLNQPQSIPANTLSPVGQPG